MTPDEWWASRDWVKCWDFVCKDITQAKCHCYNELRFQYGKVDKMIDVLREIVNPFRRLKDFEVGQFVGMDSQGRIVPHKEGIPCVGVLIEGVDSKGHCKVMLNGWENYGISICDKTYAKFSAGPREKEEFPPPVVEFARGIYEEESFFDSPILADYMEENGCTDEEILAHLRGEILGFGRKPIPCMKGCWVYDLILGN